MKTGMCCAVALLGAMGISGEVGAAENNLSPAPLDAPIVLSQATTPIGGSIAQPDYVLKYCTETESSGDSWSAMRVVDPAFMLKNYLERHDKTRTLVVDLSSIKTTMLEGTTYGVIFEEVDNKGLASYHYDPKPAYEGKDKAVFMAEFKGKRYKIVIDLVVSLVINENEPVCPKPQLIKVNAKPVDATINRGGSDTGG